MAALTKGREVDRRTTQELMSLPVEATKKVWKGAFVGQSASGHAQGLVAGDKFLGLAFEDIDNSAGADGDKNVTVYREGDFEHALAGAVVGDIGKSVYASDDNTLTLTAGSNSFVGYVRKFVSAGNIVLRIQPEHPGIAHVANPTGGATVDSEARTAINSILATLEANGFHLLA